MDKLQKAERFPFPLERSNQTNRHLNSLRNVLSVPVARTVKANEKTFAELARTALQTSQAAVITKVAATFILWILWVLIQNVLFRARKCQMKGTTGAAGARLQSVEPTRTTFPTLRNPSPAKVCTHLPYPAVMSCFLIGCLSSLTTTAKSVALNSLLLACSFSNILTTTLLSALL